MKIRTKLLLLICASLFLMVGCQNNNNNADKIKMDVLSQEKRIGIIQSLGGAYNSNQATHLLRMENGKTIFLKSSVLDLTDEKYQKRDVEVSGTLVRTVDGEQVMNVQSIDLIEKETVTEKVNPQWKDYESTKLGLKFKYRDDLQLLEKDDQIILTGKTYNETTENNSNDNTDTTTIGETTDTTKLDTSSNSSVLGLDDYVINIYFKIISSDPNFDLLGSLGVVSNTTANLAAKGLSKSKITVKALDAYKESDKTGNNISYYLRVGDKTYLIKMDILKSDNVIQDQNLFYDILASVDFTS